MKHINDSDEILRVEETLIETKSAEIANKIAKEIKLGAGMFLDIIEGKYKEIELEISADCRITAKGMIYTVEMKLVAIVEKKNVKAIFEMIKKIKDFAELLFVNMMFG